MAKDPTMDMENMDETKTEGGAEEMAPADIKAKIEGALAECMKKIDAGEYKTINEAVDAIEADLDKLVEGGNTGSETKMMGGLGLGNAGMDLPAQESK